MSNNRTYLPESSRSFLEESGVVFPSSHEDVVEKGLNDSDPDALTRRSASTDDMKQMAHEKEEMLNGVAFRDLFG